MKPAPYAYHRAHDVRGATQLLSELGDDAKLLAGGQSLVAMMNFRLARPTALVDIDRLTDLSYIKRAQGQLRVGALTRHHTVETCRDPQVLDDFAVLSRAARWIGHYPIRARGTVGGSLAHADSTAEWCLLAALLDARMVTHSVRGQRSIPASEFFHGFLTTELEPDEMVTEIVFPNPAPHAALTEFAQRKGDFAIVAAGVHLDLDGRSCRGASVALGGVDAAPLRVPAAEQILTGTLDSFGPEVFAEAADVAVKEIEPGSDVHGSADYRRKLARTLIIRACEEATGEAPHP